MAVATVSLASSDCTRTWKDCIVPLTPWSNSFPSITNGVGVVGGTGGENGRPREQPAKACQVAFVPGAGEHLHANCVAHGNFALDQHLDAVADRGPRVAEEFDPRRGVDQDHLARPERISSRSPSQPVPRRLRASSSPRGSAANVRNAKFTASRFVESRWRRMTSVQASSSMSMLVRVMWIAYTRRKQKPSPRVAGVGIRRATVCMESGMAGRATPLRAK